MALHFVATRPDPALFPLPWDTRLEDWDKQYLVPLPQGLSRHVVRIIRTGPGGTTYVAKETEPEMAHREYRLLRDLGRLGLPSVVPQCVVTGRETPDGEPLPAMLVTRHLQYSMPYRWLFSHGLDAQKLPALIDAQVVLLVRLHLANFFWGDVSLSNVLFRRSAGDFAAYLVDAETGELRSTLSDQMREYDVTIATENVFAELLDLLASGDLHEDVDPHDVIERLKEQYDALWAELTQEEEFGSGEMWRVEQRIQRLNDLGFDVDEIEMDSTGAGDRMLLRPKVVELGHHSRELQSLTGMSVEENQARRLLNDIAAFARPLRAPGRGAHGDGQPVDDPDLRADHGDGAARDARQARAGGDLPRDPPAPVVPLRAGRPRVRHLRHRPRLPRERVAGEAAGRAGLGLLEAGRGR